MIFLIINRFQLRFMVFLLTIVMLLTATGAYAQNTGFDKAPPAVINALTADQPQDVIVLLDDTAVISQAEIIQTNKGLSPYSDEVINFKAIGYGYLKNDILSSLPPDEIGILEDYSQLPMMFLKIRSLSGFAQLVGHPGVVRVYENERYSHFLTQSLPLINQPAVAASGKVGTGTTVAVLDTGVNYTLPDFGSCSAPSVPAGCKVVYAHDFPPDDGAFDDNGHGTNVAGIVLGVASDTRIAALDVFSNDGYAYSNYIIAAINWCISNKSTYNIVAMNMSFGGGSSTSLCPGDVFAVPVADARSAGILSAIASGNNGFTNQISSPGCVPAAVSVGAVYDSSVGSKSWSVCTDLTTFADKVTCFSNSASFLTILAPGSVITAAGISMSGTSQATPHIAGSIAVLKGAGAFSTDTPDQTVQRMTSTGVQIIDSRNAITKPRINLLSATAGAGVSYSISGTVTSSGNPLQGVTITLSDGASAVTTTDALGNYSFTGLSNGSYTVTPGLAGYTFTPANRAVPVNGADVTGQNFTGNQTGGQVTVLTPNGSEVLAAGSAYQITWAATGAAVKFTLEYSKNNGTSWNVIATNVAGTNYNWTVPAQLANKKNCRVRVTGYTSGNALAGSDISDAAFRIVVIVLTSPNGAEVLTSGTNHTITWTTGTTLRPISQVNLYYKYDATGYKLITTFAGSNPGTYNWPVPAVTAKKMASRVKVELTYTGTATKGNDISDANFTIQP